MSGYSNQEFPKTSTSTSTKTTSLDNDNKIWSLNFEVDTMQLYNAQRYSHFDNIRKLVSILTLALSSSAVYGIMASVHNVAVFGGIFIAIVSIVDVVCNFTDKQASHFSLYQRYYELLAKIESEEIQDYRVIKKIYDEIGKDQLSYYRALGVWCHNQICFTKGIGDEEMYNLSFWHKLLKNWYQFNNTDFHKK